MSTNDESLPKIETVAVLIHHEGRYLLTYNQRWSQFTLPMTKRHTLTDPTQPSDQRPEEPCDAAIRAVVEVLGRPLSPDEFPVDFGLPPLDVPQWSGSDGQRKRYKIHVFNFDARKDEKPRPIDGGYHVWLTKGQASTYRPISITVMEVLDKLPLVF